MTLKCRQFVVALVLTAAGSMSARAQTSAAALSRLASPVDTIRVHEFYELNRIAIIAMGARAGQGPRTAALADHAKHDPKLATALIALLHRENDLMRTSPARSASIDAEKVMDYRIDLAVTVARMRDPASVNELLVWAGTGGPVRDALISFGEVAVSGLVAELTNIEWAQRLAAASALGRIAGDAARPISPSASAAIRRGLLRVLENEPETYVRVNAVGALATFGDDEVRRTIERLAASDPATDPTRADAVHYPVREAAKAWLGKHPR